MNLHTTDPRKSRIATRKPGGDCRANPCGRNGCGTLPEACHGQWCEVWWYTVLTGAHDVALSLSVSSGIYPDGFRQPTRGTILYLHLGWPIDRECLKGEKDGAEPCEYVAGGR